MKLLEYEAKAILKKFSIPTPTSSVIHKVTPLKAPIVLKSQVPIGGRGKAGGVRIIKEDSAVKLAIEEILALPIQGYTPNVLLAEEPLLIKHEYYLSLIINKSDSTVELMAHTEGGVEIESQSDFRRWPLGGDHDSNHEVAKTLTDYFQLPEQLTPIAELIDNLYRCFIANDATLLEINPLILTADNKIVAGDCKMTLDDAAWFRHPEWNFEDTPANTSFVTLDPQGGVATIANGAGLAMATVDGVADAGLTPANFLDIGGGANEASVLQAFKQITEYPNISAIVINIFAGITRCDEVAKAIISAKSHMPELPKLYIRLAGTNYETADILLSEAGIPLLPSLEACLHAIKEDNS